MTEGSQIELYGLLGKNISYSLSPCMHNAAFRHFKNPARYELFDVEGKKLNEFLEEKVFSGVLGGFNVTVPYKVRIKDMLGSRVGQSLEIDEESNILGAVNTVKIKGNKLFLYNTDGKGFYKSLVEDAGFDAQGKKIFVVGAGGAGKTIAYFLEFLCPARPEAIYMYDVDEKRLGSCVIKGKIIPALPQKISECDLVINATPLGTRKGDVPPFDFRFLRKGMLVYDLVYARETELVKYAEQKGITAINGKGMLINQAAMAFNIWTQKSLDSVKKIMKDAFECTGR